MVSTVKLRPSMTLIDNVLLGTYVRTRSGFLAGALCPECGGALGGADYRPAPRVPVPLGIGTRRVPNGQEVISIVGGLLVSQLLTLFTTPVIYIYLDRLSQRFSRKHSEKLPGFLIPGGAAESAD